MAKATSATATNQTFLKDIFEKKYDRANWVTALRRVFNVSDILATPRYTGVEKKEWDAKVYELGSFETAEGHLVGLYEVPVNSRVKLERNKVGLREMLKSIYKNEVDAAFIAFDQDGKWRFSYVSEIRVADTKTGKRVKKTTDPKRYTYVLGEGERCKTASDMFARIPQTEDLFGKGVTLKAIEEAFNVDKLSKAFFDGYRSMYGRFTAYLTGKNENNKEVGKPHAFLKSVFNGDEKAARDFVKKTMGRIVFLYFLEKKGWLGVPEKGRWGDGDVNFLSNLYAHCNCKEIFYSQVLVPLFFKTLNKERIDDLFDIAPDLFEEGTAYNRLKTPFLNGGLFEEEENKKTDGLVFDQKLFADLFDFFDQYNFTVYEDSPDEHTVAVDPEMLGHIFENLLEDNKDKGAFYTPKEIVHYMCRESLAEYLHTRLNPDVDNPLVPRESIERFIQHKEAAAIIDYDEAVLTALRDVKICDPAIGSGAFPMGLLHEIFYSVELLSEIAPDTTHKVWKLKQWDPAKVKLAIIENSIYGVDIEPGAVDIARLRFWLSLVVDEDNPQPLPNLDYKIVTGNSLLPLLKIDGQEEVIDIDWQLSEGKKSVVHELHQQQRFKLVSLKEKQHLYFNVKVNKSKLHREIEALKADILINQLTISRTSYEQNTPLKGGYDPTPKDKKHNLEREMKITGYEKLIAKLQAAKNRQEDIHFFDWKLSFAEVMTEGVTKGDTGFDIVIGNPPYVQLQKMGEAATMLQKAGYETFERTGDIYCLFYERGWQLLKPHGILCYITSNKWMRAGYGESTRTFFTENTNPVLLIDFAGQKIFESATVDTNILLFTRDKNKQQTLACIVKEKVLNNLSIFVSQQGTECSFSGRDSWTILSPIEQNIKKKIERVGTPLKDWDINIYRGILTGYNEAFIIDGKKRDELIAEDPKSAEIIRPILRGRDIKRYSYDFDNKYLIATFPSKNYNIDNFPAVKKFLEGFMPKLKQTGEILRDSERKQVMAHANENGITLNEKDLKSSRKKTANKWFETQDSINYWDDFSKQKIVWKRVGSILRFCYDNSGSIVLDSTCFATGKHVKFLVAILNSKIGKYLMKDSPQTGTGDLLISVQAIEPLRIPIPPLDIETQINEEVDLIICNAKSGKELQSIEKKLDIAFFHMFNLSEEEVAYIESL